MDLWEANNAATQLTPHPCNYNTSAPYLCTGSECSGSTGICDQPGCEFNPYRQGHTDFYGPNGTVNTNLPFTVVTQFVTDDGTANGDLKEIRRLYKQGGVVYLNPNSSVDGLAPYSSISDEYCQEQKEAFNGLPNTFAYEGGMAQFTKAVRNGMVLVFSIVSCLSFLPHPRLSSSPFVSKGRETPKLTIILTVGRCRRRNDLARHHSRGWSWLCPWTVRC